MESPAVSSSAPATEGWHSQLLQSFRQASADASASPEDADLLSAIATDLADCSARECVTFMLPALDRHAASEVGADAHWSAADSALLRGLALALPHVRQRQRLRTVGDCLQALLRRVETATSAEAAPEGTATSASTADGLEHATAPLQSLGAASTARDIQGFLLSAAEALLEPSGGGVTADAVAAAQETSALMGRFICSALGLLVEAAASVPDRADPARDGDAMAGSSFGGSSAVDPLEQAYGQFAALAAALLGTLPRLESNTTDDLVVFYMNPISGDESASTDEEAEETADVLLRYGQAGAVHAAFCCPDIVLLRVPVHPDKRLTLALGATKVKERLSHLPSERP